MKNQLTDKGVRSAIAAKKRARLSDGGTRGGGQLRLEVYPSGGAKWVFREPRPSRGEYPIGPADQSGRAGLTLAQARDKATEYTKLVQSGVTSLSAHFAAEEAAKLVAEAAQREADAQATAAAERRATRTLRALVQAYADHLRAQGKPSWRRALNSPALHVPAEILDMPAADVRAEHLLPTLRRLIDTKTAQSPDGKGTAARLLRAHLRAAYALALSADADPTLPDSLRGFGVELNPLDRIPARGFARFNRAGERALSWPELIAYRKQVEALGAGTVRDALLLQLLLGGQRFQQLVRVRGADVDLHGGTIRLFDPKGKRTQPRRHVLPLQGRALELVKRRIESAVWTPKKDTAKAPAAPSAADRPLLSHRDRHLLDTVSIAHVGRDIAAAMLESGEARAPFKLADIRRTCETLLAGMRVPRDVRAHLLSHGLGGVQEVHYVRHDFLPEMREALEQWESRLYAENVVPLADAQKKAARKAKK
jgi:integrase